MRGVGALAWAPRILGLGLAAFLSVFAFDALEDGVAAVAVHLVPSVGVVGAVLLGWWRPRVGGVIFVGLGAAYLVAALGQVDLLAHILIAGPLFVTGVLFLVSWLVHLGQAADKPSDP